MTDNKDEEHLDNPENLHTKNPSAEITPVKEPESTIPNQETENMEVHHHAHHGGKKSWKSYFWEFLMLFLAVFCGFLAEYQLEHKIERDREKQYVESFVEDLKFDTASISKILIYRQTKLEKMDSLMLLLSTNQVKGFENELYYFGRHLIRSLPFQNNDRTITQLKNSGGLRLIRSEQAADSIISYQKMVEEIKTNEAFERNERINSYPALSQMFDPYILDKMVTINDINRPNNNPGLKTYDPRIFQDVAFYVHAIKGSMYTIEVRLQKLKEKAINTITFLQKEYHLE